MATKQIGSHLIKRLDAIPFTFIDETNRLTIQGRRSVVMPTELTLPDSWTIPRGKKLSGWRQGDYEYKPGKAVSISLISASIPIEAVYIDCFVVEYLNPFTEERRTLKYAAGAFINDFLSQVSFKIPEGKKYKGMLAADGEIYQKKFISQDETLEFVCE